MQEACEVINRFWFEALERAVMRVPKAVGNAASRRVTEREGMRLVEVTIGDFVSGPLGKEIWELRREDWLKQPRRQASGQDSSGCYAPERLASQVHTEPLAGANRHPPHG